MQRFITTWTLPITFRSADPHFRTAIEALLTGIEPESLSEAIRQVCYVLEAVEVLGRFSLPSTTHENVTGITEDTWRLTGPTGRLPTWFHSGCPLCALLTFLEHSAAATSRREKEEAAMSSSSEGLRLGLRR